jgi:hypothetical protein
MTRGINKRWPWAAAMLALAVASGCSYTPVRQHPDFASAARKVQKIAVLPPDVEYQLLVLTGDNERLPDEERNVTASLTSTLPGLLEKRGYSVREFSADKLQQAGKDANFTLQQVKTAYGEVSKQLYEQGMLTEDEANQFRVSVGPVVNPVAEALEADGLLLVRYAGFKKSDGLIAKEVVSGALLGALTGVVVIPAPTGASMEMALLDAATGDVLWANRGAGNAALLVEKLPLTGAAAALAKNEAAAAAAQKPSAEDAAKP